MAITLNGSTGITDADGGTVLNTNDFASQAQAQAGTDNTTVMTPLRAADAITAQVPTVLNASGSAPVYACRAWVNFNGLTGAIRADGNVASVVRNSAGNYTITFTTAMPDANYAVSASSYGTTSSDSRIIGVFSASAGSVNLGCTGTGGTVNDGINTSVAIFR